jgi:hypothetical protein
MLNSSGSQSRFRKEEALEFRLLYAVSFALFLVAAVIARLVPWHWRPFVRRQSGGLSIIGEARAAASTCIPFAFMG